MSGGKLPYPDFAWNGAVIDDGGMQSVCEAGNVAHVGGRNWVRSDSQSKDSGHG